MLTGIYGKWNHRKGGEKPMKMRGTLLMSILTVMTVLSLSTASWGEDVRQSKHNLATNPNIGATGTTEVCVFCHTPHGGATTVGAGGTTDGSFAPLWNRNLSQVTNYTMYTSPNFDGAKIGSKPIGVSLACLSCHDGTVAFDSLLNHSGSGATPATPITFSGSLVDTDKSFKDSAGPFPNLGIDLSNDHPISMEIPCGVDKQFDGICANIGFGTTTGVNLGSKVAFLVRDTAKQPSNALYSDSRNKLRAYPSAGDGKPYIECASCHNPHIGDAESTRFLRLASYDPGGANSPFSPIDRNAGSLICLSCHEK